MATGTGAARPRALDALFLVSITGGVLIYVVLHRPPNGVWLLAPPLFAVAVLVIVVGWFQLSWEREHRPGPRLASVLFAVVAFLGTVDAFGAGAVCALATANLVFVWGVAPAAGYVVLMVAGNIAVTLARRPLDAVDVGLVLFVVILYTTVCVTSEIVRRSRDDKRRTESLLDQLACAHAELSERADRIRELTVAGERARFARDMHDSVGHHLTAVALALRSALRMPPERAAEARHEVEQALELAGRALDETRRTVRALRPLPLTLHPLDTVLDSLLHGLRTADRRVELQVDGCCDAIDDEVAAVVYRTVQEAITNVVRHSDARTVRVALTVGDPVELEVCDDGTATGPPGPDGSGLRGLAERARGLGGTLVAGPGPSGFALRLRVPARAGVAPDPVT